ncbi:hypothetical protein NDI56_11095 [Haloarcula sp. S1CR25-12]|uniref:DUF4129 domain-containing protein n=1 Tax=Haloarcula saliterrae TaxID=2950534 RepID=A0ABU2FDZ1_9EURY|nr:hypothetical protein [Haloarcula sp. S1CR25-12]MDS0259940.1 hypothetical protein [Haloarcula sp. S1CR25-12]
MPDTDSLADTSTKREYLRAFLAVVCILAVVVAAAALPGLTLAGPSGPGGDGTGLFPADSGSDRAPGGQSTSEVTTAQPSGERPTSERMPGERTAGDRPTGDRTGEQPSGDRTGEQPSGDRTGEQPSGDRTGEPSSGDQTGEPSSGDQTGEPSSGDSLSDDGPSEQPSGGQTGESSSGDRTGEQPSGDQTGEPSSGDSLSDDGPSEQPSGDRTGESSSGDRTGEQPSGDQTGEQPSDDGPSEQTDDRTVGNQSNANQTSNETESADAADDYTVSLNRSATAGAVVEVTVTDGGTPAAGVRVSFNGDSIGTTDDAGTVTGRVPYESRLNVTIDASTRASLAPPRGGDRLFAVAGPGLRQVSNETFTVDTNVTLALSGPLVTDGTVTLTATVDDVPVRDAAVTVGGEQIATTDDAGRASVTLPTDPGNYTLGVVRGSASGERTVSLAGLAVETSPSLPLALPGTGLAVTVTAGGEAVPNATVALGGDAVAQTGPNGTATAGLPLAGSVTVTVRKYGQLRETAVDGLLRNLAAVLVTALALAGGVGYLLRRRGVSGRTLSVWFRRAGQLLVTALLWLVAAVDTAIGRLRTRFELTVAALRAALARRRTLPELWAALRGWVRTRLAAARATADSAATAADPRTDTDPADDRATVRAAWGRFLGCVSLRDVRTATPGEIAAHAIEEDDIPPEAVGTLREAYRAVEYGQYDPQDHVSAVEGAIRTIERTAGDTDAADEGGAP